MSGKQAPPGRIHFGIVDLQADELGKHGLRIKLQEQRNSYSWIVINPEVMAKGRPRQLMSLFTVRAIVVALIGGSFAIFANMISFAMIGRINERVPENERISYSWWGTEVRRRFEHLYPESKLTLLLDLCIVLIVVCFLVLLRFWVFN
jgi:hypothetical protein